MAKVKKFEEIQAWKKARSLTKEIYRATLTGSFARDFGLKDQMRRASVSILSNIAEGFERGGDKEFLQFLAVAKALLVNCELSCMLLLISNMFRWKRLTL